MSFDYIPLQDETPQAQLLHINRTFQEIERELAARTPNRVYKAPSAPFNTMMIEVDGVSWDPGSGAGIYIYYNGWVKLA
jgi:hypothetical protein